MSSDPTQETPECGGKPISSFAALNKNVRHSERIVLRIPIRVSGAGEHGREWLDDAYTEDISRHGATIVVNRQLAVGQNINVQRVEANKQAEARVVDRKAGKSKGYHFGIAFTEKAPNVWDIEFPSALEAEKAVLRNLLTCAVCGRLEVAYLDEFESDLFLSHHNLPRLCAQCQGWTVWARPYSHIAPVPAGPEGPSSREMRSPFFLARGFQNHRAYERVRAETVGYVRKHDRGEVVVVRDLGRGGLSFCSPTKYTEGEHVEMAVPYSSRAPNVFLPVRIADVRSGNRHLKEYSAAYIN